MLRTRRAARSPAEPARSTRETSLTALAAQLDISKQAAGRIVEDMGAADLVSQRSDPADGRARILALTERGRAMVDAAIEIAARYEQTMRAELGPEGARSLRAGLERVVTCC